MIVSGERWRDSAIHTRVSILPHAPLPSRLPHDIEQKSLCYAAGPCWLSILDRAVWTCPLEWGVLYPKLSWRSVLLNLPWGCFNFLYLICGKQQHFSYWYQPENQKQDLSEEVAWSLKWCCMETPGIWLQTTRTNSLRVKLIARAFRALIFFF